MTNGIISRRIAETLKKEEFLMEQNGKLVFEEYEVDDDGRPGKVVQKVEIQIEEVPVGTKCEALFEREGEWYSNEAECGCDRCTTRLQPVRAAGLLPPFGADQEGWWEDAESRASYAEDLPPRRRRRKAARKRNAVRLDGRQHRRSRKAAENAQKFEEAIAPRMKAIREEWAWDPGPIVLVSDLSVVRNSNGHTHCFSQELGDNKWQCYPNWV